MNNFPIHLHTWLPFRAVYTHSAKTQFQLPLPLLLFFYLHRFCEGRPVSYQLPLTAPISWRSLATTLPPSAAPPPLSPSIFLSHLQKKKVSLAIFCLVFRTILPPSCSLSLVLQLAGASCYQWACRRVCHLPPRPPLQLVPGVRNRRPWTKKLNMKFISQNTQNVRSNNNNNNNRNSAKNYEIFGSAGGDLYPPPPPRSSLRLEMRRDAITDLASLRR